MSIEPKKASEIDDATALALKYKTESQSNVKRWKALLTFNFSNEGECPITNLSCDVINSSDGDFLSGITVSPDDDVHNGLMFLTTGIFPTGRTFVTIPNIYNIPVAAFAVIDGGIGSDNFIVRFFTNTNTNLSWNLANQYFFDVSPITIPVLIEVFD